MATSATPKKKKTSAKKSGNPAKRSAVTTAAPTAAAGWKKSSVVTNLELPSGNVCRVKRLSMEKLLNSGVMPDNLSAIAMREIRKAESGGKPQDHKSSGNVVDSDMMDEFMKDDNAMADMFDSFDKITAHVVVEPEVRYHRRPVLSQSGAPERDERGHIIYEEIPYDERAEDVLYTDDVDMDDKTFIFQYVVGGDDDLEKFRAEFGDALATLQHGDDV